MIIRPFQPGDLAELHRINQANAPAVGAIDEDALAQLISASHMTLVALSAETVAGFVLCLVEGCDYASLNYAWIGERYPRFAYVDRVAIDADYRNRKLGQKLYESLAVEIGASRSVLTCEVNELPPNPGSMRFHERLGFRRVGRRAYENGAKAVVYYEKTLGE